MAFTRTVHDKKTINLYLQTIIGERTTFVIDQRISLSGYLVIGGIPLGAMRVFM